MWKPVAVVPEHKTRATLIWAALLLGIFGYIAWQIVSISDKYDHPSTSFSVSDDLYDFPPLYVCIWDGQGCDERYGQNNCMSTALFSVLDPCYEQVSNSTFTNGIALQSQYPNCLEFDLAKVDMEGFHSGCGSSVSASEKPSVTVYVTWIESDQPFDEDFLIESAGVFLGNGSAEEYSRAPYSRVVTAPDVDSSTVTFRNTYFSIGKHIRRLISGESIASYPVLTMSTINFLDQGRSTSSTSTSTSTFANGTYATGYLYMTFTQSSYSLTVLTDIDPLDVPALLGNIGGFWEILLVTWGLCFIATREETPTQRGRDFSQPIQKGKEFVARKRRSLQSTVYSDSGCYEEARPYWETRHQRAFGGSIRQIPSVNGGSVGGKTAANDSSLGGAEGNQRRGSRHRIDVAASSFRQPIPHDYPRRSSSMSDRASSTGEIPVATTDQVATTKQPQNRPPSYADCA